MKSLKIVGTSRAIKRFQLVQFTGTLPKLNSIPISLKNRPRIPTPDVSKEIVDHQQRLALAATNTANIGAGVVGVTPPSYHAATFTDVPFVQVAVLNSSANPLVLSPIQGKDRAPLFVSI